MTAWLLDVDAGASLLRRRRRLRLLCLRRTSWPSRLALTPKGRGPGAGGVKEKSLELSEDKGDLKPGMGDIGGGALARFVNAGRLAHARRTPGCGFGECGAAPLEV